MGEMLKSVTSVIATNALIDIGNCNMFGGTATFINLTFPENIHDNLFHDSLELQEFYRDYSRGPSWFTGNVVSNIQSSLAIALNGGYYGCPTYTISNNVFYTTNTSQISIATAPASDVLIISNGFYGSQCALNIGQSTGYQDPLYLSGNSNLVFSCNYLSNCFRGVEVNGSGQNNSYDCLIVSNFFDHVSTMAGGYGWGTNIVFSNNVANFYNGFPIDGTSLMGQYFIDSGNTYPAYDYSHYAPGSQITYAHGSFGIVGLTQTTYNLDDTADKNPAGATLTITNEASLFTIPIYLNIAGTGSPYTLAGNSQVTFYWTDGTWKFDLLKVNSGSGSGAYTSGQIVSITANAAPGQVFTQWSGATNILANPFAASTTATMPAKGATVTATYAPEPPLNLQPLK
jgi:hypothetical protein